MSSTSSPKVDAMTIFREKDSAADAPPTYDEATQYVEGSNQPGPQPFEIVTHLRLLYTLHKLRERVENDGSLFDLDTSSWLQPTPDSDRSKVSLEIRKLIAEKRWDLYVKRAALRFESWWDSLRRDHGTKKFIISDFLFPESSAIDEKAKNPLIITKDNLPPLDVLMIWHSFLLSPHKYLKDCLLQGMMSLWHAKFPWRAIHDSTMSDLCDGRYDPGQPAVENFERIRPWSNEEDACTRELNCPICGSSGKNITAECSTFATDVQGHANSNFEARLNDFAVLQIIKQRLMMASGWADNGFCVRCKGCGLDINRDVLCAAKFVTQAKAYATACRRIGDGYHPLTFSFMSLWRESPLPSTMLLSKSGLLNTPTAEHERRPFPEKRPEFFPNVFVETISHVNSDGNKTAEPSWPTDMHGLRQFLQIALNCRHRMLYATGNTQRRANKTQRVTIRKMMSYYNDNPWRFTLDLASAVHRQGKFIHKMQHIDWLHSPALHMTTSRVIKKYSRFLEILSANPGQMAVPTLDIDLGWHTDQLTPSSYRKHTIRATRRFVDHDDKVSEQKLSTSFAWTSKIYQRQYKEPYSECTCWYCEAMHASIEKFPGRFWFGSKARGYRRPSSSTTTTEETLLSGHSDNTMESKHADVLATAHISTHNAVRISNPPEAYRAAFRSHLAWLDKAYQRACVRAKKDGRPPPVRRHLSMASDDVVVANHRHATVATTGGGGGTTGTIYYDPTAFGSTNGTRDKRKAAVSITTGIVAGGALGVGMVAIALTADGGLAFEDEPECVENYGAGGCVGGACGGGVGWGGGEDDNGGLTGACGGGGGTCAVDCGGGGGAGGGDGGGSDAGGCGGDDGGGCGGCGGCGG